MRGLAQSRWMVLLFGGLGLLLGGSAAWAQKSGVDPNVLTLPKGPGSLGGIGENVQANLNMGLMSYTINIVVPQGRGNATPRPSLTYSSASGSGLIGIGWGLSAGGSIERLTVRGLPTYSNQDRFYANEELVKIPGSVFYRVRMEGGFVRYQWVQKDSVDQRGYWIAEYPDGSKGFFGANSKGELDLDSQVYGFQGTFRWELRTMLDRNGNRVEYTYFKDGTQVYLDHVTWVFDKSNKPLYRMSLVYEERPDPISDGKPGFDLQTLKRVKEIQIYSAGQIFRTYKLTFEDATGLSRLIQVTRYGLDGKTAHPVQFSMKYSNATFSEQTSRLVTMPTALGIDFSNRKADFLDINGDGLPDVIDTSSSKHVFHINTLTLDEKMQQKTHDYPRKVENPFATSGAELSSASVQMIDFNGDGFTDMVDAVNKAIYINKGNGQWENGNASLQSFPVDGKDVNMRFFEYNGDKAIDVISSNGSTTTYWVSDTKGNWTRVDGRPNLGVSISQDKIRFIDINGDGLSDAVQILKSSMRYKKYLGYGNWSEWIEVKVPDIEKYELSDKAQFEDLNGDGMADMVVFLGSSIVYFVNKNGKEFYPPQTIADFKGVTIPNSTKSSVRIADMNGNGSRDIVWIDPSGKITYLELFAERPNLMREISNGIGQRINVEYGSSVYYYLRDQSCNTSKDKACAGPWANKMPMPFTVVTAIKTWASRSDKPAEQSQPLDNERPMIQNIYYHDGYYDGSEKKFRGFRHVETLFDGDSSVGVRKDEIKYDVGDKDAYFHGRLLERTISDGAGKIFQQVKMEWVECPVNLGNVKGADLDPPVRFICQKSQEMVYIEGEGDKNKWKTVRDEMSYDGFGNVILQAMLGDIDKTGDEKYFKKDLITPTDPNAKDAKWLLIAPQRELRCVAPPEGNAQCAETQFYYDGEPFKGLPLGQLDKGNLVRIRNRVEVGKDEWREPMARQYDEYGNLVAYRVFGGHTRQVEYDAEYARFATKEEIDLGTYKLTATTLWDTKFNAVIKSTTYNNQTIFYTYDVFGRITSMSRPGDEADKPSMKYTYQMKAPLSQIITEKRSKTGGEFDQKQIVCFDGLGRQLSTRQMKAPGQYQVYSHTEYNRLGLRARVWNVYEAAGEQCDFEAPTNTPVVSWQYDGLGRMLERTAQDGTQSKYVYLPLMKMEYDEEDTRKGSPFFDTPKTSILDGLGRVIKEIEIPKPGETIETSYAYNPINSLHEDHPAVVTFADGSQKKQEYDLMGNITKVIDPDRKETTMVYNALNQLAQRTDARGIVQIFAYDSLGRLLSLQEKDKPETAITYAYDTLQPEHPDATNLKGYMSKITYPGGYYTFSYDGTGQPVLERHHLLGVNLDFKREYDNDGGLLAKTYPDGRRVEFQRDAMGRPVAMPGKIKQIAYNSDGTLLSWEGENGIKTTYSYNKRQWITGIDVAGGKVMKLDYTLDFAANIVSYRQQHGDVSFENTYTYDALYRLDSAKVGPSQEVLRYQQDKLGNLVSKTSSLETASVAHVGAMVYDKQSIHRVTQAGEIKLSYDNAGHMVKRDNREMTWDHLGRCVEMKENSQTKSRAWYGNQAVRVIKEEEGLHTFYVDSTYEIREGRGILYLKLNNDRVVASSSPAILAQFFDDVAPAQGDGELKAAPDGKITAGDAWLYHAGRNKILTIALKNRPLQLDLTRDMLQASLTQLLEGEKEQVHYYHASHLGSVRAVTDAAGEVVARKHYYPYGAIREQSGQIFSYGYMGSEYDRVTQTHRFEMRSLDPKLGRWLSPDPLFDRISAREDEFNSYGLVRNNPLRMREFHGTFGLFGMDSNTTTDVMDWGIVVMGGLGAAAYTGMLIKDMFTKKDSLKPGQQASRTANRWANGLMALSYALWGAAAYSHLTEGSDKQSQVLTGAMFTMWAGSEAASAIGAWKSHRAWKQSGEKGGRGIAVAKTLMTATVATGAILSMSVGGQVGEIASYATMGLFVLSAGINAYARWKSSKIEANIERAQRRRYSSSQRGSMSTAIDFRGGGSASGNQSSGMKSRLKRFFKRNKR